MPGSICIEMLSDATGDAQRQIQRWAAVWPVRWNELLGKSFPIFQSPP